MSIIQLEREKLVIKDVKSRIAESVALLKSLGADYQKVAWMLEDSLSYIDEAYDEAHRGGEDDEIDDDFLKSVNHSD